MLVSSSLLLLSFAGPAASIVPYTAIATRPPDATLSLLRDIELRKSRDDVLACIAATGRATDGQVGDRASSGFVAVAPKPSVRMGSGGTVCQRTGKG